MIWLPREQRVSTHPCIQLPKLFGMWKEGQFPFDRLLAEFRFEDMEEAMGEMKKGNVIKPVLVL